MKAKQKIIKFARRKGISKIAKAVKLTWVQIDSKTWVRVKGNVENSVNNFRAKRENNKFKYNTLMPNHPFPAK